MQPSASARSKLTRLASRSATSRTGVSRSASVVSITSIVASPGASIPAPLAMPPMLQPSPRWTACLLTVSVVMIAVAASSPPSRDSCAQACSMPDVTSGMGNRTPISPVEQTATSPAATPSPAAVFSAMARASANPGRPVQAFAPPEFRTTAHSRPSATALRDQSTGAANTRLRVKTPAAANRGPRLETTARSGRSPPLIPAAIPAAANPAGVVTLTVPLRSCSGRWSRRDRGRCSWTGLRRRQCPW